MASLLILGNTLVDLNEFDEMKKFGQLGQSGHSDGSDLESISFSGGEVLPDEVKKNFDQIKENDGNLNAINPYTPIGLGKPLSIEILTIYTGDYPNGPFGGRKDLMLASAVKNSMTFDAAARAINKLDKKANEKTYIEFSAMEPGTRVVFYSPALDSLNTLISFEMVIDTFEQEIFDHVSKLLTSAAGLPVFLPAANILLGGSHLLKLTGGIGNTLFAKKTFLKSGYEIKFNNAGDFDAFARHLVLCNDKDIGAFKNFESKLIEENNETRFRLVHKTSREVYRGNAPYMIINLDGQRRTDLENFTPKLVSSALLQKFYGEDDMAGKLTSTIEEAMQLYNDLNYKIRAEKLQKVLKEMPEGTDDYKKNIALLDAYKKNIRNDAFMLS